ncbi:MAG: 1-acyl-sn-glycerol-3-phosphate acyltransferase [Cyanothece sp. SIO1E1]|nr:1-acyl-sn-glycerol-3-phosphate acyltransferase [Cyanothece sp. SIO1E1]
MPDLSTRAQPPLEFVAPDFNPFVLRGAQALIPLWFRNNDITAVEADNVEVLAHLYQQFQAGKTRFMLAFRHPGTKDPPCMCHLLWHILPQVAKQQGIALKAPVHAHFIYDRGIPIWAGKTTGWLISKLGGTPILRGKFDREGLRSARNLFAKGEFPLAAAPEGGTNGHNQIISPLEPGIAQFGFWCVEDLLKANRTEQVVIVPVGIQYQYTTPPWQALTELLTTLEADSGLTTPVSESQLPDISLNPFTQGMTPQVMRLYQRLYRLAEHLLSLMEEFYTEFYRCSLPKVTDQATASSGGDQDPSKVAAIDPNQVLSARLEALMNVALQVAEEYFGLQPKGGIIDRCRRLEQAGWDCIYREDMKQGDLSEVERGLADLVAEEANLRMWHMRIAESFVAVTGRYVMEHPTADRFAETLILLWQMVTRIKGKGINPRPQLGKQAARITIGQPLSVSERWAEYKSGRRGAVANLTQDLRTAMEAMLVSSCS